MPTFDKIKFSDHQRKRMLEDRGHFYTEAEAASVVGAPTMKSVQDDHRIRFWGTVRDSTARVVVSAAVSAGFDIGRVVTMHCDRLPKKAAWR